MWLLLQCRRMSMCGHVMEIGFVDDDMKYARELVLCPFRMRVCMTQSVPGRSLCFDSPCRCRSTWIKDSVKVLWRPYCWCAVNVCSTCSQFFTTQVAAHVWGPLFGCYEDACIEALLYACMLYRHTNTVWIFDRQARCFISFHQYTIPIDILTKFLSNLKKVMIILECL